MTDLLARLKNVVRNGDSWTARCPAHDDQRNSLSIHHRDGRWLLKCHAGCGFEEITAALGTSAADFFDDKLHGGRGALLPPNDTRNSATLVTPTTTGLTLGQYAAAKALTADFLKSCGLSEVTYDHRPAVRIPYYGPNGEELAVRFRIGLDGDRFRWKSGTKPCLYGLHRLAMVQAAGYVVLVEGESDCHTLWSHGAPALGIPGAANWREDRDARHLDGIETIYVVVEPDRGGDTIQEWLSRSSIRHRAKLIRLPHCTWKATRSLPGGGKTPAWAQRPGQRSRPRPAPRSVPRHGRNAPRSLKRATSSMSLQGSCSILAW
jgi:hypothetical protein